MRGMALTSADLDALDRAIAAGELEVEFDGMRRRYRSISELLAARAHVASVLTGAGSASGGSRPSPVFRFGFTTARGD